MSKEFDGGIVIDTPEGIAAYRLLALHGALKLETFGMRRRGQSALSIIKAETGIKGRTAADVLPKYEALLRELGVLVDKKQAA